jgi:polysaccharide biosynthesis protein PslG
MCLPLCTIKLAETVSCTLTLALTVLGADALAADTGKTIEVKLGAAIERTWEQVQAAKYAYGPKQEFNAASGETHIWLPYGSKGVYFETVGVNLSEPGPEPGTGCPQVCSVDGNASGRLVFKLHFDKPISAFRFWAGWSEWGVGGGSVGGVEYSVDGKKWTVVREINEPTAANRIIEPLVAGQQAIKGLKTENLYLRCYSRDKQDPEAGFGPGRWMKLRMGGDPAWGDVAMTFFNGQLQLWVVPAMGGEPGPVESSVDKSTAPELAAAIEDARKAAQEARAAAEEARRAAQEAKAAVEGAKKAVEAPAPGGTNAQPRSSGPDARDDASPWGIASGAEWSGEYPKFNPLLDQAGVKWIRLFTEWHVIQPRPGEWRWDVPDRMVANIRANHIHPVGLWCYFTPWASADGGTRKGPIKDMQSWRDYVTATVNRYQKEIKYWEVWNEFNGSFYQGPNKVKEYADMAVAAYDAAKKVDPDIKVGLSVANFDVAFLDATIKAGAAGHFDFICVHPYENLGTVAEGGEVGFLSLAGNLRDMLKANKQPADTPLWITEIGYQVPVKAEPERDARQADMLAKAYLLSIVQGFQRIFWFEARGPAYGQGTDHGIIRPDWTLRPAYSALKTMTALLGEEPKPLGWLDLGKGGYGFLFGGKGTPVLAAWSPPGKPCQTKFDAEVAVTDLAGKESALPTGQALTLSPTPVFLTRLPDGVVQQAKANLGKPYPWGGDYAHAKIVTCRLGALNKEDGLKQVNPNTTVVVNDLTGTCRRTDFANPALHNEGHYVYFRVDPLFVPFGTKELEITIVAKRVAPDKSAGMNLMYESTKGYTGANKWWTIPAGDQWQECTWKISDASFVGQWGYNFRFDAISSPNEFLLKEVRVSKRAIP